MLVFVSLLEEFHSFFLVMLSSEHHVIVNDENTMPDRYCRPLLATPFADPSVLFPQVRLRAACGMSRLNQRSSQPAVAFACPTTEPFACTFVLTGTHSRPRGQMGIVGKATHICSHLSKQDLQNQPTDSGDLLKTFQCLLKRLQPLFNLVL